jgi:hypothetical protein
MNHLGGSLAMASEPDQIGLIMQLRRRGIRDTRVLRAIELVPPTLIRTSRSRSTAGRPSPSLMSSPS